MNWCEFFAKIEENPSALIKGLTVRDYYEMRDHMNNCDVCYNVTERVLSKHNSNGIDVGLN